GLMARGGHRLAETLAGRDLLDDVASEIDDGGTGAEVLIQGDAVDVGVAALDREDVLDGTATPLIDRLVVVADHAQVRAVAGEPADQLLLDRVGVLVLVDDD